MPSCVMAGKTLSQKVNRYFSGMNLRSESKYGALLPEKVSKSLLHHLAANLRNGSGEGNLFGANLHTVLRVAAFLNATIAHEGY